MKSFEELLLMINSALENLSWEREPQGLYAPIAYTLNLGGKRIRPALTLMAFSSVINFTDSNSSVINFIVNFL